MAVKTTIEILDEDEVINPEHWCRPLYLEYSYYSDSVFTRSEWGGGPINNMKWTKVKNVLGPSEENKKIQFENLSKMRKGISFYHGRGENNGYHKLSNNQVSEIKELQKNHYRGQDLYIANQFGVSRELISQIRRGKVRLTG